MLGAVAGLAYLGLAGFILAMDPRGRVARALALLLVVEGAAATASALRLATESSTLFRYERDLAFAEPFVVAWFVVTHRAGLAVRPRPRALGPLLLAGLVAVELWVMAGAPGPVSMPMARAVAALAMPVGAIVLARDALATAAGPRRAGLLLVAVAFAAWPLFALLHWFVPDIMGPLDAARLRYLVPLSACAALALLALRAARGHDPGRAEVGRRLLGWLALPVASVVALLAARYALGVDAARSLMFALMGVWVLAPPALVAYAVLRHRVFGLDARVRFTLRHGSVAAAFLGVFFVVSESAAAYFSQSLGTYAGIGAAGVLLVALAPLQRLGARLADAAVPAEPAPAALGPDDRRALYREHAVVAWADGALDRSDRALLDHLRARLGLTREEAATIESEAAAV